MKTSFTYIVCPVSCNLQVEEQDGRVLSIGGNRCPEGHGYALQEVTVPMKNATASIRIKGNELPLASVRLSAPTPKKDIFRTTEEVRKVTIRAPAHVGDVTVRHLPGAEVNAVVTKNVLEA